VMCKLELLLEEDIVRTWFITGTSRGLGLEITRAALEYGDAVVATARRPEQVDAALPDAGDRLLTVAVDVNDEEQIETAVAAALERFGRIDVLVNNAGRGLLGAVEEVTDAEARAVFDTNVFGTLAVTRAVIPVLRQQREGKVINISSVGGFTQGPGWGVYGATKSAIEGFSEAMWGELAPLGIDVIIVEPGVFRTDFLDSTSLHKVANVIDDYAGTAGSTRAWVQGNNHLQVGDASKAAAAVITIVNTETPPLRLQLGADCVTRFEAKIQKLTTELNRWRDLSVSTAHEPVVST